MGGVVAIVLGTVAVVVIRRRRAEGAVLPDVNGDPFGITSSQTPVTLHPDSEPLGSWKLTEPSLGRFPPVPPPVVPTLDPFGLPTDVTPGDVEVEDSDEDEDAMPPATRTTAPARPPADSK